MQGIVRNEQLERESSQKYLKKIYICSHSSNPLKLIFGDLRLINRQIRKSCIEEFFLPDTTKWCLYSWVSCKINMLHYAVKQILLEQDCTVYM